MIKNFRVCFYLRSNYKTNEGKTPVLIRLYLQKERITLGSASCAVDANKWDSKKGRVEGRNPEALQVNNHLERIEADLVYLFRKYEFSDTLSLDFLKAQYLGKGEESESFLGFFDDFLKKTEAEVGISRTKASFNKYDVIRRRFSNFLKTRFLRTDLLMGELSYKHISEFEHYLITECHYKHNTAMRIMKNLRTVVLRAIKLGYIRRDPFANYKFQMSKTDRGFLTDEEISTLMSKQFSVKRLEQVRDIFVFSCFTGLAYIDLAQLTSEHLVKLDGQMWIIKRRQKTNVPSNILLLDIPAKIIKKYKDQMKDDPEGHLLPVCSNQKLNAYLKEIADLCGIEKRLSCHLARHTFATLALSKGVSVESVSKMLGHTNIATTQIYARIVNKKIECDMVTLAQKLGDFDAIAI